LLCGTACGRVATTCELRMENYDPAAGLPPELIAFVIKTQPAITVTQHIGVLAIASAESTVISTRYRHW